MPPSQVTVTADNRGPLINLANWLTLAVVCLAAFTKVGTKVGRIGTIQKDDVYMLAAMVRLFFTFRIWRLSASDR